MMGWTWEVEVWKTDSYGQHWSFVYQGESWFKAIQAARKYKKVKPGSTVRVIWR